jgi:hypothetical protein
VSEEVVRWPRVKEILANIMGRWERREGRKGLPGVHGYYWETPQELANDTSMGLKFIQPGIPASNTALIISLRKGLGSIPKMPMNGPFLKEEEIQEIERWIDSGMPE